MTCARLVSFHSIFFVNFLRVSIFVVVVFGTSNDSMQKCAVIVINTREEFHLFDLRFVTRELDRHFTHFPFEVFTRWLCIKHLFLIFFLAKPDEIDTFLQPSHRKDRWLTRYFSRRKSVSQAASIKETACNKTLKFRTK